MPEKHEFQDLILTLFQKYESAEEAFRERRVNAWRLLDDYWHGVQKDYYDNIREVNTGDEVNQEQIDQYLALRILNVYRAHGESIISALSNTFPTVGFFPEDADKPEDVSTATTKSKLGRLIVNQNKPESLLAQIFYIMYNQDFVACLLSTEEDFSRGVAYEQKKKKLKICPECEAKTEKGYCPECKEMKESIEEKKVPKKYQCLKTFGPRQVAIPGQARDVSSLPYVILRELMPTSYARWLYDDYADEIGDYDISETNNRALLSYKERYENNEESTVIITFWVQPWALNALEKNMEDDAEKFLEKYPNGAKVKVCRDVVLSCVPEDLTEVWCFTKSPLNETFYDDPIGKILIDNQDLMNETFNLIIKTISQGAPETVADPEVLDTDAVNQRRAEPGNFVPAKAKGNRERISDAFYTTTPTHLSENVISFLDRLQQQAQFLSDSYPSIYGGNIKGSRTVGEYQMSGERALERLSIRYRIVVEFLIDIIRKAVDRYMKHMADREVFVMKFGDNFVSDAILKDNLSGKTGRVEVEGGGHVPLSWTQIKSALMELLNSNNEMLATLMSHPQNSTFVKEIIGVPDLYIPGEDSKNKQLFEIAQMLDQEPPAEGESSVPIDSQVDNHAVEFEVCQAWLSSEKGLYIKQTDNNRYLNVQWHAAAHAEALRAQQQPPEEQPQAEEVANA